MPRYKDQSICVVRCNRQRQHDGVYGRGRRGDGAAAVVSRLEAAAGAAVSGHVPAAGRGAPSLSAPTDQLVRSSARVSSSSVPPAAAAPHNYKYIHPNNYPTRNIPIRIAFAGFHNTEHKQVFD